MIALGVLAAVELARRRAPSRGATAEDLTAIATWAVPAGLLGARLYHVITDWRRFQGRWGDVIAIWEGGLGVPGGLAAGAVVGLVVAHRRGLRLADAMDICAPCLPLAQAIGRWGNWWNQELFGRPTSLPWALEIDPEHRPAASLDQPTYHPTFLYESLWNLGLCGLLLLIDRQHRLRPGQLFWLYVGGYGLGRLWVEALRIDPASELGPFRVNTWVSLVAIVAGIVGFVVQGRRPSPATVMPATVMPASAPPAPGTPTAGTPLPETQEPAGPLGAGQPNGTADSAAPGVGGMGGEDGVAEGGPGSGGPGTEGGVGEDDAAEPGVRVDPAERPGPPEVAERPR
jgi:prolipoprotein diacylglyceryl transferase